MAFYPGRTALILVALAGLPACGSESQPSSSETTPEGKAAEPPRVAQPAAPAKNVREKLEGLDEPLAQWLLQTDMTDDGFLKADYMVVLENVGLEEDDCPLEEAQTFVLSDDLVAGKPFPRTVSTICRGRPEHTGRFFIAASFADPKNKHDIDLRNLELFAWEESQKRIIFYAMTPVVGNKEMVRVDVEPERCAGCHLTPSNLDRSFMPMLPIMNELIAPWPHWNGKPGFESHETFIVPPETANAPNFRKVIGAGAAAEPEKHLAAARDLQLLIEGLHQKVGSERIKLRNAPAQVDQAMSLLRPLFCEEQVNYVSEDGGQFPMIALTSLQNVFDTVPDDELGDPSWTWLSNEFVRFEDANTPLNLIPVRAFTDIQFERRMINLKVLTPFDVMRIRAIDWRRPIFSQTRCNLWKSALAQFRAGEAKVKIAAGDTNKILAKRLLPFLLKDEVGSLIPATEGKLIATSLVTNLSGTGPRLIEERKEVTMLEFGEMIETHVKEVVNKGRPLVQLAGSEAICVIEKEFPNQPALPKNACSQARLAMAAAAGVRSADAAEVPEVSGTAKPMAIIPEGDPAGLKSVINIGYGEGFPTKALVRGVAVRVSILHPWRGDLLLTLTAPDGTVFTLADFDPADSADNVEQLYTPFMNSEIPAGDWTLTVVDRKGENQGLLRHWTLGVNTAAPELLEPGERPMPTQKN